MLQESRRLTGLHPCYGPHDPLRPRGRAVLSGTSHSLNRILPSLFLNSTLGTSVLTVVGYTHIGLPTSERTGQDLGLDYSQSPPSVLGVGWGGTASRTSPLPLSPAQHRATPTFHLFLLPLLSQPHDAYLGLSGHVQLRTGSPEVR